MPQAPSQPAQRTTVVLADDHAPVREAMASVLTSHGFEVVGQAGDGRAVPDLVQRTRPDVVLLDVRMPHMDGLQALEEIRRRTPDTRVLMLSTYEDPAYILKAVSSGAAGYLLKGLSPDDLVHAVERTVRGESITERPLLASIRSSLEQGGPSPTSSKVVEAHLRAFGRLTRELLRPDQSGGNGSVYYSMVQTVSAYGLAVAELLSAQKTERERLERQVHQRTEEARRAQAELAAAERKAALARLAASAAHGIRTPLCVISNALSVLELTLGPADRDAFQRYAQLIRGQVGEADRLVTQLVRYADLERVQGAGLDLVPVVAEALTAVDGDGSIRWVARPPRLRAIAHEAHTREALELLFRLSLSMAGEGAAVTVELLAKEGQALLRVRPGQLRMRPDDLARSFEPLLCAGTKVVNFELVLTRGLLEAQGASLGLDQDDDGLTYLELAWPLAEGGA